MQIYKKKVLLLIRESKFHCEKRFNFYLTNQPAVSKISGLRRYWNWSQFQKRLLSLRKFSCFPRLSSEYLIIIRKIENQIAITDVKLVKNIVREN